MSKIEVDEVVNQTGDNDSGIDLSTNDVVKVNIAGAEKARVHSDGKVGIGTNSPDYSVHVKGAASQQVAVESTNNTVIGAFTASTNDLFIGTVSNDNFIFETNGTERMRLLDDGRVGVGGSPSYRFHSMDNAADFSAAFWNDGDDSNRKGIIIQCGKDDASGTNIPITFSDGNGDAQGQITFSSGTVTYGAFTAYHQCIVPNADNDADSQAMAYPYGTLLETTSISYTQKNGADTERGILYNVQKTQSANSKKVLGAYGSSMNDSLSNQTNMHQVLILGDGHILCNNAGGNISIGDGICSSSAVGIGQKATANPSMIIGIAQEAVTFSGSETKLVAVQYGLQQFIPWS